MARYLQEDDDHCLWRQLGSFKLHKNGFKLSDCFVQSCHWSLLGYTTKNLLTREITGSDPQLNNETLNRPG